MNYNIIEENMKKTAFSLAELLVCLILIGFMAVLALNGFKTGAFKEKQRRAEAYKVFSNFSHITAKLLESYPENFPSGALMYPVAGTYNYGIYNDDGEVANESDIVDIYSKLAQFKKSKVKDPETGEMVALNFCNYSDCEALGLKEDVEIPGALWFSNVYIGFLKNPSDKLIDECPSYFSPEHDEEISFPDDSKKYCWGKLYVDTNGKSGPNTLGQDVYIFGLDETGIAR